MLSSSWLSPVLIFCCLSIFTIGDSSEEKPCEIVRHNTLNVVLGSSVHLPCHFNSDADDCVFWQHGTESHTVVRLTCKGRIRFSDPRNGRVKAYYIQSFSGNYSISIDNLQESDLGQYYCVYRQECFVVELTIKTGDFSEEKPCEIVRYNTLNVVLGSSVHLPCHFNSDADDCVFWQHGTESHTVVRLTRKGRIRFSDPRNGRVKAYYIQSFAGDFSISIDNLQESDLGQYYCVYRQECFLVELSNQTAQVAGLSQDERFLVYFFVSGGLLILLGAGGYCVWNKTSSQIYRINNGLGPSSGAETAGGQQRANNLVYDNDTHMNWGASVSNLNLNQPAMFEMKATPGQQRAGHKLAAPPSPMAGHMKGCNLTPNLPPKNTNDFVYNRNGFSRGGP
ncbi:uncharacterized protein LOC128764257 isoform X1 [Synchiropus splendidus]|uniref:uncharacterized protein LOC128764257 isoform X1 n=1 Tax=Synchiropus splendidus TaxID=270530 RepID=UPI00237E6B6B|nr:uncharacterized protein LOC128764257 isoform X1 [Synchiropus splendidus]